jgi:hypothetical protein
MTRLAKTASRLLTCAICLPPFSLCLVSASLAQGTKTCADIDLNWPTPDPKLGPINSPDAQKPTDPIGKAGKASEAKKQEYMKCNFAILSPLGKLSTMPKARFDQRVISAVKAKQSSLQLARAIYISSLASTGTIAKSDPGIDQRWWMGQIESWCRDNDPVGLKKLPLPALKSVLQSVEELDREAIALGWERLQKVDGDRLKYSCDSGLQALVSRAGANK